MRLLQDRLQCSQAEVENWIVRAIGRRLLEARIDQLQRLVTITRTTQRSFSQQDWGRLAAQLKTWQVRCRAPRAVYCCGHADLVVLLHQCLLAAHRAHTPACSTVAAQMNARHAAQRVQAGLVELALCLSTPLHAGHCRGDQGIHCHTPAGAITSIGRAAA